MIVTTPSVRRSASAAEDPRRERCLRLRELLHRRCAPLFALALLLSVSRASALSAGESDYDSIRVRLTLLHGATVDGVWQGSKDGLEVRLDTEDGRRVFLLNDLVSVDFPGTYKQVVVATTFHLADGGRLVGELLDRADDGIVTRTVLGEGVRLPFDKLAGIELADSTEFPRSGELFDSNMRTRLPGQDVLITREKTDAKTLRGRLEWLSAEGGAFVYGSKSRRVGIERLFGVVLAAGTGAQPEYTATFHFVDGSTVSGRLVVADTKNLRVATSIGVEVEIPLTSVDKIAANSDRVVFLSDLSPQDEQVEGRLHRPRSVRRDQSISGGSLVMNGRVFKRGLGCCSRTRLSYDLAGKYELLAATIGIDDHVRPRGSVVFRVLEGNSETDDSATSPWILFDSGLVTGEDAPRDIIVDVSGVSRITLVVDYGDELDLSDHADWGSARVIKVRIGPRGN